MALCSSGSGLPTSDARNVHNAPFRATQLWREIITSFREGMPRRKKRVKIRVFEECFTGLEAVEWLHFHLQTSENFGNVSREQVLKLLQKFLDCDVIRDVRGKLTKFDVEGSTLYCFVTEPGPLNFVEDMDTSQSARSCPASPIRPRSPLGKHTRPSRGVLQSYSSECEDTFFTNEYAFLRCDNDSTSESAMEVSMCSQSQSEADFKSRLDKESDDTSIESPMKKCRSDSSVTAKSNFHLKDENGASNCDNFGAVRESNSTPHLAQLTPVQVAGVWKDVTLNRLLRLVELETLEGVLAYDAVDGKQIATNIGTCVASQKRVVVTRRTTSTAATVSKSDDTPLSSVDGGCGDTIGVGGACSYSIGSTHPHWLNRQFGSRLSRIQSTPQAQPPAANVHSALCRSRSARGHQASSKTPLSITLHHKLRYSIKRQSDSDVSSHLTTSTGAKAIPASRSCNSLRGAAEGGGRVRESVMDVPHWVALAMKCLAKWPDGCTEEFVGGMAVYGGFELDVLQSLVQYFNSLSDPLISPKLFDLHMAVLRLVKEGKPTAVDALQLCSLLLPQSNRTRLHRVLRLIHKSSYNRQLVLSKTKSNRDVLLEHFSTVVLKSAGHSISPLHMPSFVKGEQGVGGGSGCGQEEEKEDLKILVGFMSRHYQQIFKMPDNLRKEVQERLKLLSMGKDCSSVHETRVFCRQVSSAEYEQQRQSLTDSLVPLLDNILADTNMSAKVKKQRLKQFQKAYPEIYASRVVDRSLSGTSLGHIKQNSTPNLHTLVTSSSSSNSYHANNKGIKLSKGRTLSKLASNHYSSDCLAPSKPVLR